MKEEIRQNGHSVLYSEDSYSNRIISNNLTGEYFKGGVLVVSNIIHPNEVQIEYK